MTDSHDAPDGEVVEVIDAEVVGDDAEVVGDDADEISEAAGEAGGIDEADEISEAAAIDPLAVVTAERDEYLDSLRRLQAEFENYRKRVAKQQIEQVERAAISLVDKVLPALDALDLAAAHLGDAESDDARALVAASGLLNDVLAKEGLERIDPAGEAFDPNAHEAVGHLPDAEDDADGGQADGQADDAEGGQADGQADDAEGGQADGQADDAGTDTSTPDGPVVAQVMRPGYRWRGTVVRPAMVMVRG